MAGPTAIRQNVGVSVKRNSLSLGAAVGLYGNAFGAAAVASGFSVPQACFISLILFSGASQFAAVGVIGAGGNPLSAIATAAFGSELAPQVQLLREVRDNVLFSTGAGTTFMAGFNEFYYAFSPTVADWERQSPLFKEVVKTTITPMLSTMSKIGRAHV